MEVMLKNEDVDYTDFIDVESGEINLKEAFGKENLFFIQGLDSTTASLLGHSYFNTHPRKFWRHYLHSLQQFLSLNNGSVVEFVSKWVDKMSNNIALCEPFLDIFESVHIFKALFYVKKNDLEMAILHIIKLINCRYQAKPDEKDPEASKNSVYSKAVAILGSLTAKYDLPIINNKISTISQSLTLGENAVLIINDKNTLVLKVFVSSNISLVAKTVTASIKYQDIEGKPRTIYSKLRDFEIKEGQLCWIFEFPCPNLKDDTLTFDKLAINAFGGCFIMESTKKISANNCKNYLNYKIEASKLHLLNQIKTVSGEIKEPVLSDKPFYGLVLLKLNSNEVKADLKLSMRNNALEELNPEFSIVYLDSQKTEQKSFKDEILLKEVSDKNFALLFNFKCRLFTKLEKRPLAKMKIEVNFHQYGEDIIKSVEQTLMLSSPGMLGLDMNKIEDCFTMKVENLFGVPLTLETVEVCGQKDIENVELQEGEVYSLFYNNEEKKNSMPFQLKYQFDKNYLVPLEQ